MRLGTSAGARGVSMIEVMVAVLVLSVGLLGMAALQGVSMRNNQSANHRTQATNLAYQLIDIARSYKGSTADGVPCSNVRALIAPMNDQWTPSCAVGDARVAACADGDDALACDRRRWWESVCATLPNGRARTQLVCGADPAVVPTLTVELCWTDDRSVDALATADCTGANEGFGQLVVGPDGAARANNAFWMVSGL